MFRIWFIPINIIKNRPEYKQIKARFNFKLKKYSYVDINA